MIVLKKDNLIKISFDGKTYRKIDEDSFLDIWNGVIVAVEAENRIDLEQINTETKKTLNVLVFCLVFALLFASFYSNPSLFQSIYFGLALVGFSFSLLIAKQELGFSSKLADGFCSISSKVNCEAVLSSKGATVFGKFKLSDLSLVYFLSLIFGWILIVNFSTSTASLSILSIVALPMVVYSVYYQYFIVKNRCSMCLSIALVLLLQGVLSVLFLPESLINYLTIDLRSGVLTLFSFLFVTTLWVFVKPLFKKEMEYKKLQIKHLKFKRNFNLFYSAYSQNKHLDGTINMPEISFGNINAPVSIVLVSNPMCHYCKSAHVDIEKIITKHFKDVNVIIRFNVNVSYKTNLTYQISSTLMAIYHQRSNEACREALQEVYKEDVNLEKWLRKWNDLDTSLYDTVLEAQHNWCINNTINFTPSLLINGRQFPKEYEINDLLYFIEELSERFKEEAEKTPTLEKQYI
ncbi:vitamin K epoxide reductase family protein [Bizionia echini]|uniref:vitamin K epoxide reductase family protein n=1 Tax=Bizionia echini TaxID=649333 RepID=UPI0030DB2FBC